MIDLKVVLTGINTNIRMNRPVNTWVRYYNPKPLVLFCSVNSALKITDLNLDRLLHKSPGDGGGGEGAYKTDVVLGIKPVRGAKCCRHGLKCFSPLRDTNSNTKHHLLGYFFLLNTLKGSANAHSVDLSNMNALRGSKTSLAVPLNCTTSTPPSFLYGSPPPPPHRINLFPNWGVKMLES